MLLAFGRALAVRWPWPVVVAMLMFVIVYTLKLVETPLEIWCTSGWPMAMEFHTLTRQSTRLIPCSEYPLALFGTR